MDGYQSVLRPETIRSGSPVTSARLASWGRLQMSQFSLTLMNAMRPSFEEGHDDEGASVGLVDFVDRADVGVVELGGGFGFAFETFAALFVAE